MLNGIFGFMIGASLLFGLCRGQGDAVLAAMLSGAGDGVKAVVDMAGMFALFCGMASILRSAGAAQWLAKRLRPVIGRLLGPDTPDDALEYAVMNLTANLLGLGNAATPMGIRAARAMHRGGDAASDELCLLVVCNSASIQLIPATVAGIRAAAGARAPFDILPAVWLASAVSVTAGILAAKLLARLGRRR